MTDEFPVVGATVDRVPANRQARIAETFVELVDTLLDDFDIVEFLAHLALTSAELVGGAAAGVLLVDESGRPRPIAASSEQSDLWELFELQGQDGPCMDCIRTEQVVAHADLADGSPWPLFAEQSLAAGFPSVCVVPLRLHGRTVGCLNLFMSDRQSLSASDITAVEAAAALATIALVQDEAVRHAAIGADRLHHALASRVTIEQAKGMIAEHAHIDPDEAFWRLRRYARANGRALTSVAAAIVTRAISPDMRVGTAATR